MNIPVDPDARTMKLIGVPRGVQLIVNIDGSKDRLEVINPTDGRLPFFRLVEPDRLSEAIELSQEDQDDELGDVRSHQRSAERHEAPAKEDNDDLT
jgi:hypothetical protein